MTNLEIDKLGTELNKIKYYNRESFQALLKAIERLEYIQKFINTKIENFSIDYSEDSLENTKTKINNYLKRFETKTAFIRFKEYYQNIILEFEYYKTFGLSQNLFT